MLNSLRTKLTFVFVGLLFTVQIITLLFVYNATAEKVYSETSRQLEYTGQIFLRQVDERVNKLTENGRLLAADFGFREAVASDDQATTLSALLNLKNRIQASRVLLIDKQFMNIADTGKTDNQVHPFPYEAVITHAEEHASTYAIIKLDNKLYEFVIIPVKAPITIAWIGIGFVIDDKLLQDLKSLAPLPADISVTENNGHSDINVYASTLAHDTRQQIVESIGNMVPSTPMTYDSTGDEFIALRISLKSDVPLTEDLHVFLQYSLQKAFAPYRDLLFFMISFTVIGLLGSVMVAVFLARTLTRPVLQLAEATHHIKDGQYNFEFNIKSKDELGQLQSAFKTMQTAISSRENEIKYQAYHDQSTGLANRLMFETTIRERIENAVGSNNYFSIIMIGIQRLHEINYILGHDVSDELIRIIGEHLQDKIDATEVIARISSDTFALLINDDSNHPLIITLENILTLFNKSLCVRDNNIDVFINIGAANYPAHGIDDKLLLQHADVALNKARDTHKKFVVYEESLSQHENHLSLMGELRAGIDRGELCLHYQPQIDIKTQRISHVEALVRWQHPERGFMPPDDFIPLAERTGNIHNLTRWVLAEAISQRGIWASQGLDIGVAINLSANDLLRGSLEETLQDLLAKHKVEASSLVLEITESALMEDPSEAVRILQSLKTMGFVLSIDDYGTGYSSLEYLKRLPIDELKIDKSFIQCVASSKTDQVIVTSAVDLGHKLDLKVIAEGIEDTMSLDYLQHIGCDIGQGYLFSRPLSLEKFNDWLIKSEWGITPVVTPLDITKKKNKK